MCSGSSGIAITFFWIYPLFFFLACCFCTMILDNNISPHLSLWLQIFHYGPGYLCYVDSSRLTQRCIFTIYNNLFPYHYIWEYPQRNPINPQHLAPYGFSLSPWFFWALLVTPACLPFGIRPDLFGSEPINFPHCIPLGNLFSTSKNASYPDHSWLTIWGTVLYPRKRRNLTSIPSTNAYPCISIISMPSRGFINIQQHPIWPCQHFQIMILPQLDRKLPYFYKGEQKSASLIHSPIPSLKVWFLFSKRRNPIFTIVSSHLG